jgi:hypothetical protein
MSETPTVEASLSELVVFKRSSIQKTILKIRLERNFTLLEIFVVRKILYKNQDLEKTDKNDCL